MKEVVYIEDDTINAYVFKRMLKDVCEVDHYLNGEAFIEACENCQPAIIFIDINLGSTHMDGVEVMQRLRTYGHLSEIPIVALTAFAFHEDEDRFIEQGFSRYLSKPVDRDYLVEMVAELTS